MNDESRAAVNGLNVFAEQRGLVEVLGVCVATY